MIVDPVTGERDFAAERRREREWRRIMDDAEWAAMNATQPPLDETQADADAIAHFDTLDWIDDQHRNRALWRLRGMSLRWVDHPTKAKTMCPGDPRSRMEQERDSSLEHGKKPSKWDRERWCKTWWITTSRVDSAFRRCRARPLAEIAEDLWALLDAYDRDVIAGKPHDHERSCMIDELVYEANDGTSFGSGVNRGPKRLWTLIRWRARREGRLPMWGVPSRFRFTVRGMPVVADMRHGLGLHIDEDRALPGDLCWSETGYRSMSTWWGSTGLGGIGMSQRQYAEHVLTSYIDGPRKTDGSGGLGGYPVIWRPYAMECWHRIQKAKAKGVPETNDHVLKLADLAVKKWWGRVDFYALFPDVAPPRQPTLFGW